jgi:hypothetical protein
MSLNLSSENVLLFPRVRSEDDISDYEEYINKIISNLNLNKKVISRIECQSPIPSSKYIKYIDNNNNNNDKNDNDNDDHSIISDLTEYEDRDKENENDDKYLNEEEEINYKIWPIDFDYMDDYEEGYEECYKDDVSETNGYYSYNSC